MAVGPTVLIAAREPLHEDLLAPIPEGYRTMTATTAAAARDRIDDAAIAFLERALFTEDTDRTSLLSGRIALFPAGDASRGGFDVALSDPTDPGTVRSALVRLLLLSRYDALVAAFLDAESDDRREHLHHALDAVAERFDEELRLAAIREPAAAAGRAGWGYRENGRSIG